MSWLSENSPFADSSASFTAADPNSFTPGYWDALRQNPTAYAQYKEYDPVYKAKVKADQDAADAAALNAQLTQAQATTPVTTAVTTPTPLPVTTTTNNTVVDTDPTSTRANALAQLNSLFGGGDPNTLVSSSLGDPFIQNTLGAKRAKADNYIGNLLKRGVITPTGQTAGTAALDTQTPKIRSQLNNIGNVLLEQERGNVRGIYNEGVQAAGGLSKDQAFDPSSFYSRAQGDIGRFTANLPDQIASQASGDLFDTSGLGAASGAATGSQNLDYDPYAVAGGKLSTGTDASGSPVKRRSTAVF